MVPDLRSCTMLSTLPLLYIAQSVNSDDRRARFKGLLVTILSKIPEQESRRCFPDVTNGG